MNTLSEQPADFRIDRNGAWYHDGAPIKRDALAKLFADRALKIDEAGQYWLQTPFEKYPVIVEDVPFIAVDYEAVDGGLVFRTNMQETVFLSASTQWELREGIPYFEVRDGLFAKLARSVYYNLVEEFGESFESDGKIFNNG